MAAPDPSRQGPLQCMEPQKQESSGSAIMEVNTPKMTPLSRDAVRRGVTDNCSMEICAVLNNILRVAGKGNHRITKKAVNYHAVKTCKSGREEWWYASVDETSASYSLQDHSPWARALSTHLGAMAFCEGGVIRTGFNRKATALTYLFLCKIFMLAAENFKVANYIVERAFKAGWHKDESDRSIAKLDFQVLKTCPTVYLALERGNVYVVLLRDDRDPARKLAIEKPAKTPAVVSHFLFDDHGGRDNVVGSL